uniref:DUF4371 domain-containing protein n=1 Tax=Labrus bergylta TaxID=56723 RepID=A0A3Q3M9R7_9LABR
MCVICRETLANESLKPTKLKRHLEALPHDLVNKPLDFFQRKAQEIKASADVLRKNVTLNDKAQLASYIVSYRVATERQPHNIAEKCILLAAIDMVTTVMDAKSTEKIKCIPLSNNTVSRRIHDISNNLEEELISRLKAAADFSIQLDESTDVSDCATLLVYVRYVWGNEFLEDLLCCLNIPTGTTGEQIFDVLNDCVVTKCSLDWANCKGITSDGAAIMTGRNSDKRIKGAAGNDIVWNHCFIHRHALASKGMPVGLEKVLKEVVRRNTHTYCISQKRSPPADIFSSLNELNLKLQGHHNDVFRNWKHVIAFQKSLKLWLTRFKQPNTQRKTMSLIQTHLGALIDNFDRYFPKERFEKLSDKRWNQNPFEFESPESLLDLGLSPAAETELLHLCSDVIIASEYPVLSKSVGFSVYTKIKTKYRNRLDAVPDMRVALSSCTPDWDTILKSKQAHLSH